MFQPWRIKLREADDAFRGGRLDEAGRLLCQSGLREFRPAKDLLAKVVAQRVAEAEQCLAAGDGPAALARLDELDRRHADTSAAKLAREAATRVAAAERFARRGEFVRAREEWQRAAALLPHVTALDEAAQACKVKGETSRDLTALLHGAVAGQRWSEVLTHAETLLAICPDHEAAREARRQAWSAVGVELRAHETSWPAPAIDGRNRGAVRAWLSRFRRPENNPYEDPKAPAMDQSTNAFIDPDRARSPLPSAAADWRPIERFLLWVDGVGGYLVCTRDEVTLGQPVPESAADIGILGDLSRRHAKIRRDGETYLIEPRRPVRLDGRTIDRATALADGAQLELGNVRLVFRRPHPLSITARLDFVSPHRTQPAADAVLLMAESCVLGPSAQHHVACGDWSRELILYRQGDDLYCRRGGLFQIDGQKVADNGKLTLKSQVSGEDFSLSIEGLVA
ncbi:MAG TPA: hypothetical protein VHC22_25680 [Pirellulales bacterium]|nr:hypothetical protein [Pirellulales bacterium]